MMRQYNDYRASDRALPRHDGHLSVAPVEAFEQWMTGPGHKLCRNSPPAAKIRRVVYLCESGENLKRACELVGIRYDTARERFILMPDELRGKVLTQKLARFSI